MQNVYQRLLIQLLYMEMTLEKDQTFTVKLENAGSFQFAVLDDAKKLYSGFDLSHAMTSVSMTINGPAPMLLGFFMNAAIDQNCEKIHQRKIS